MLASRLVEGNQTHQRECNYDDDWRQIFADSAVEITMMGYSLSGLLGIMVDVFEIVLRCENRPTFHTLGSVKSSPPFCVLTSSARCST